MGTGTGEETRRHKMRDGRGQFFAIMLTGIGLMVFLIWVTSLDSSTNTETIRQASETTRNADFASVTTVEVSTPSSTIEVSVPTNTVGTNTIPTKEGCEKWGCVPMGQETTTDWNKVLP